MSWLLYLPNVTNHADKYRLFQELDLSVLKGNVEVYRAFKDLSERFRRPLMNFHIIVLFIESKCALREILTLRDYLKDLKIILILPEDEKETMQMGFG